jgi:hypothetical protein
MVVRRPQRGHRYTESPVLQLALQKKKLRQIKKKKKSRNRQ